MNGVWARGAAALFAALALPARAEVVHDSFYTPTGLPASVSSIVEDPANGYFRWQSQSYMPSASGLVTRVDLQLGWIQGQGDLLISLGERQFGMGGWSFTDPVAVAWSDVPTVAALADGDFLGVDVRSLGFSVTGGFLFNVLVRAASANGERTAYGWAFGEQGADGSIVNGINFPFGTNVVIEGYRGSITAYDRSLRVFAGAETSPVPEPSTWALLILGFGAIGVASRRRRGAIGAAARRRTPAAVPRV
jgi:hypothetical protein